MWNPTSFIKWQQYCCYGIVAPFQQSRLQQVKTLRQIYCAAKRLRKVDVSRCMALLFAKDYISRVAGGEERYHNLLHICRLHKGVKETNYRGEKVTLENRINWPLQ